MYWWNTLIMSSWEVHARIPDFLRELCLLTTAKPKAFYIIRHLVEY
jgi:hypothetical protein